MKKLLVVLMVLSMATIANAGLVIGGAPAEMMPSDTAIISIVGDGLTPPNTDAWLVVGLAGTATGGVMLYPGDVAFMAQYDATDESGTFAWVQSLGFEASSAYYLSFGDSQARPLLDVVVGDIVFHCDAPGDVALTLVNIFDDGSGAIITPIDSVVIHQIPEPMTMGLLGLGGLFLRRRK